MEQSDYSLSRADICFSVAPEAPLRKWKREETFPGKGGT